MAGFLVFPWNFKHINAACVSEAGAQNKGNFGCRTSEKFLRHLPSPAQDRDNDTARPRETTPAVGPIGLSSFVVYILRDRFKSATKCAGQTDETSAPVQWASRSKLRTWPTRCSPVSRPISLLPSTTAATTMFRCQTPIVQSRPILNNRHLNKRQMLLLRRLRLRLLLLLLLRRHHRPRRNMGRPQPQPQPQPHPHSHPQCQQRQQRRQLLPLR